MLMCARALYMSISMWVHVPVHIHECVNVRGVDCQVSFSVTLCSIHLRQGLSLTRRPASLRSFCICPLPPRQHWVTGTCPAPLNVDAGIQTQNLKLVQQAFLSWRHLFSPLKHYITLLKECLLAQGGGSFWTQFLRCIIWRDTETLLCKC